MELRLVVLMNLTYLGSLKMFFKPWANRMAANTTLAGVCVGAGAVRSSQEWQRVGCLLCHNVHIYCPVVVCRTTGFSSVLVQQSRTTLISNEANPAAYP